MLEVGLDFASFLLQSIKFFFVLMMHKFMVLFLEQVINFDLADVVDKLSILI